MGKPLRPLQSMLLLLLVVLISAQAATRGNGDAHCPVPALLELLLDGSEREAGGTCAANGDVTVVTSPRAKIVATEDVTYSQKSTTDLPAEYSNPSSARAAVKAAFLDAWKAYKDHAWGHDEVGPLTHQPLDKFGGMGLTIVDSLDTMLVMGLWDEFKEARDWVESELAFGHGTRVVSFFETTIRFLGGLLSAYYLTGDEVFLEKAVDLGDRLSHAYAAKSPIPARFVDLYSGEEHGSRDTTLAEATSVQLEFAALSRLSGNTTYRNNAERTSTATLKIRPFGGLRPHQYRFANNHSSFDLSGKISVGGQGDSHFEYLLKRFQQSYNLDLMTGGWELYRMGHLGTVLGVVEHLARRSEPGGLSFVAEIPNLHRNQHFNASNPDTTRQMQHPAIRETAVPEMEHLACFLPGLFALGSAVMKFDSRIIRQRQLKFAEELASTCFQMYARQRTGLSPEKVRFSLSSESNEDFTGEEWHHLLRPEMAESLFVLYRVTGKEKYRRWGWKLFWAWETYCKVDGGGYSGLEDVRRPGTFNDVQESYFLAETLKYLYLLFDDSGTLDLDEWVFNTEGHPLSLDPEWTPEKARAKLKAEKRKHGGAAAAPVF